MLLRFALAVALCGLWLGAPAPGYASEGSPGAAAELEEFDPLFDDEYDEDVGLEHDPFEPVNRWTFRFNQGLDWVLLDPLTRGYQWIVPSLARRSINNVFLNLNSPVVFANEVLQLRPEAAAATLGRFIANTTCGIGGLLDVADTQMGIPRGEADFGQTLARYGMPRGPYLVVPLFGPSTARDAVGTIVDQGLDPLTYLVGPLNLQWQLILGSGQGLALRDANLDALDALRDASVDYYAALRSAYLQSRRATEREVAWGAQAQEPAEPEPLPASEEEAPELP